MGFGVPNPSFDPKNKQITSRTALELYVGIPPSHYRFGLAIDGLDIVSNQVRFLMKAYDRNQVGWWMQEETSLNLRFSDDDWYYTELPKILDSSSIQLLEKWVKSKNKKLLEIGTEHEKFGKQFHHFMYELISIARILDRLPPEQQDLFLEDSTQAISLLHNRVHLELFSECKDANIPIELTPPMKGNKKIPDLKIDGIYSDVKSILITEKDKKYLLQHFARKLRCDYIENEEIKKQIGNDGSLFIGVWSGVINSILFEAYHNESNFYRDFPKIEKRKVIFVIPSKEAFKNHYLVFDRDEVCKKISELVCYKFDEFIEKNAMVYLQLTNIRKGCPLGVTGYFPSLPFNVG